MEMMNDILRDSDEYSNFGGRRKECRQQGLKGKALRACAKELKASGWKKGMPIPAEMAGMTAGDVETAEKEEAAEAAAPPAKSNTMTYVIIGIVLVLIIVGVVVAMRMKKPAAA